MIVHLDFDGVIFDFEGAVERHFDMPFYEVNKRSMWAAINRNPTWFEDLQLLPDALELWSTIGQISSLTKSYFDTGLSKNPAIKRRVLTATGHNYHDVSKQKIKAAYKNLPGFRVADFRSVPSSGDKALFATPDSILIDDSPRSCDPFNAAGGIAILHTSATDSLAKLRALL